MQRQIIPVPSLKRFKEKSRNKVFKDKIPTLILPKIKPISIVRGDIFNNPEEKQKLALRGYKYFMKLTTSGEFTFEKLRDMKRSVSLKLIKRFEFDAYFSKYSCIRALVPIFKKLRMATSLNMVIRRVDRPNEARLLPPFFPRIMKMKSFRIEFPRTDQVTGDTIKVLAKNLSKCVLLESIAGSFIFLPHLSPDGILPLMKRLFYFRKLRETSLTNLCSSSMMMNLPPDFATIPWKFPDLLALRSLTIKKGFKSGWVERTGGDEETLPFHIQSLARAVNLENFVFQFEMYFVTPEILMALSDLLPRYQQLKSITLEFLGCRLGELEFLVLLQGIMRCKQIHKLILKFTQRPNISEDNLVIFSRGISSLNNLEKFDVYFRGTELNNVERVIDELSRIDNIKYNFTKNSVYLHKDREKYSPLRFNSQGILT